MHAEIPPPENVDAVAFAYFGVLAPRAPSLGEAAVAAAADPAFGAKLPLGRDAGGGWRQALPVVGYALDQRADAALDLDFRPEPAATVVYETLLAMSGEPPSPEAIAALVDTFGRLGARPMEDDGVAVVRALRDAGLAIGLMSNYLMPGRYLEETWSAAGVATLFDAVVLASEWGWCLPHPSVFRELLARLGCKPEELLVVCGDFRTEVQGAEALGLRSVWVQPDLADRVQRVGQSYLVRDLGVLLDWFAGSV